MSDFDYWPRKSMSILVKSLQFESAQTPPPPEATSFWQKVAEDCRDADTEDEVTMSAEELAQDVNNEFEQVRFVYPSNIDIADIAVGDLGCAESRLVSAVYACTDANRARAARARVRPTRA